MTQTTTTARNVKAPNGSTTSFPFNFTFDAETEILVTRVVIATSAETPQVLTTDYTITGGSGSTGTVEMNTAPPGPALENLVIERVTPKTQSTDYQPNDPFPAEVNETALDKLTRIEQETTDLVNRAVKLKKNSTLAGPTIPDPEVNKILVGKTATEFENKTVLDLAATAVTLPLPIADGGTNAATVAGAQINLLVGGLGANLASATPLVIGTDGNFFNVTGTVTISTMTVEVGRNFTLSFVSSLLLFKILGNFISFPGGKSIITAPGDRMICFSHATDRVTIVDYIRADGSSLTSVGENLIINGNFDIWQRGTTFSPAVSLAYTADRWSWTDVGTGIVDILQSTTVFDDTSDFSLQVDVTTADTSILIGDRYHLEYRVEGYDAMRLGLGSVNEIELTLTFLVRSSKTGIHCVAFRDSQVATRSFVAEYVIGNADTYEEKTITLKADTGGTWNTANGVGLAITWALAVGGTFQGAKDTWTAGNFLATSNQVNVMDNVANNFHISRVDLKASDHASTFQRRAFAQELALSERYTIVYAGGVGKRFGVGQATSGTRGQIIIPFPTSMRAVPALTVSAAGDFDLLNSTGGVVTVTAMVVGQANLNGVDLSVDVASGLGAGDATILLDDAGGNAKLTFDAEL